MSNMQDYIISSSKKDSNGCWLWHKATSKRDGGYGKMCGGSRSDGTRRTVSAHRTSYEAFCGPIPDGLWVLHTCDVPGCVNPEHLYIGDRVQNTKDMMDRGRLNHFVGEKSPTSKMSESTVAAMRNERTTVGTSYRSLAKKFGLKCHTTAMAICKGNTWSHISFPDPPEEDR